MNFQLLCSRISKQSCIKRRFLHLHECQSKDLMQKYGINIQKFRTIEKVEEALDLENTFKVEEYVVKAQIHAGGRGKGEFTSGLKSGVHLTKEAKEIPGLLEKMLNYNLITHQTPKEGIPVRKVMIAEALNIARETYFAILMDRSVGGPVIVASPCGGVDIEEVAEKHPEKILKFPVEEVDGDLSMEVAKVIATHLGFEGEEKVNTAAEQMVKLYKMFLEVDAVQVEVNPFGETDTGKVVCFDAKIDFDDNAAFRQPQIFEQRDTTEEDPREVEASKYNLNYVGMDGSIGCLVNGAGLAMATMDIIKLHGSSPANFLDVGGNADARAVREAFKIITRDPKVSAILVNIFGGIMKCDTIAEGIVAAAREIDLRVPLVVRLSGTNYELGRRILENSGLPMTVVDDLDTAALKAVQASRDSI